MSIISFLLLFPTFVEILIILLLFFLNHVNFHIRSITY